jgi:hypothetical protein
MKIKLTTNGFTGKQWIKHFEKKSVNIGTYANQVLLSEDFKPLKKGKKLTIEIIKGEEFSDSQILTSIIRAEAKKRGLKTPSPEVACLIREKLSNQDIKEMGLYWILTMHEPIKDSDGGLRLLNALAYDSEPWLGTYCGNPGSRWSRGDGFAFVAPQVSSKHLDTQNSALGHSVLCPHCQKEIILSKVI